MPSEESRALAASQRGMVVAPAGCGKTYLLAEAVATSIGRQLVLTHTHAGVRAIRGHLERQGVPSAKSLVATIDGFALRYVRAFPTLSRWNVECPTSTDWKSLREAALLVVRTKAIRRVLSATYAGVFVDEYQDCSIAQHLLVLELNEIMPVRVVGDPLQAIFALLDRDEYCQWRDIERQFTLVAELNTPHRWNDHNRELGLWLTAVRSHFISGEDIDLRNAPAIWKQPGNQKNQAQLAACFRIKARKEHSMVALRQWRPQCHKLARNLKGKFRAMETVECDELLEWSQTLEDATGVQRVVGLLKFADQCMAGLPASIKKLGERLAEGRPPKPQRSDFKVVLQALEYVQGSTELQSMLDAMTAITSIDDTLVMARPEMWKEMRRSLKEHGNNATASLRQTAWNLRNRLRHTGSKLDKASLATPLLVKGLEFDHALILDANDHVEPESLYVAMTRGSRSLTILSDNPVLRRSKPQYLRNTENNAAV
jgi:superfamily I DNA/RNA helicase